MWLSIERATKMWQSGEGIELIGPSWDGTSRKMLRKLRNVVCSLLSYIDSPVQSSGILATLWTNPGQANPHLCQWKLYNVTMSPRLHICLKRTLKQTQDQ